VTTILIIDTHALIWAIDDPSQLTPVAATAMQNAKHRFVSIASVWEIAIKVSVGKLQLSLPYRRWIEKAIHDVGASLLPVTLDYCEVQSTLPRRHGDPFDRMIAGQCLCDRLPVVSSDAVFDQYGVTRIW
jgi:PIN domain nuclease of toxin-antitoxin system